MSARKKQKRPRPRIRQYIGVRNLGRGNYAVIYADEFGQVSAFDIHGSLLVVSCARDALRQLRLDTILARKALRRPIAV